MELSKSLDRRYWFFFLTWLVALSTSCTEPKNRREDEVRAVLFGIIEADNKADLDQVLSYYHEDASLLPPEKSKIEGINNIRKNYERIFDTSVLRLSVQDDEIIIEGNHAICTGMTKGTVMLKTDSSIKEINDKFMMILERHEGTWKIKRLIWN
ncbi:nuclear transport factor 2 family protein [Fulvivirgaceae bacterium BMA10]|uniref:Nuclear transport factor 2 family protein n=1 Tax=Splendidivirga corallicola TaxID=3051826 RepID=A0ABT8KTQ3_9BACT|nr:nuclear transport factor 2 family protein [Fulvivirgaceae bacterium BMA10]